MGQTSKLVGREQEGNHHPMNTSSDGTTTVTRGPINTLAAGTAQSMTATGPTGTERHIILGLSDEPLTPEQARELADVLHEFARGDS